MGWYRILLFLLINTALVESSFFEVRYPSVAVTAEPHGNLTIAAGPSGGHIYMNPGEGGTVNIGQTDMLKLFEIVNSMPPVWGPKAPFGSLGMFLGGDNVEIQLSALDPENTSLHFQKVSGSLPPGVYLQETGRLHGKVPDVDAKYEFGIRVTDEHGKYADQTFTIDTREKDLCGSNPCQNGGTCIDTSGAFMCICIQAYGGKTCNTSCQYQDVGVSAKLKTIPDAQMAGHNAYASSDHKSSEGRLDSTTGWIGENSNSWLQIDLGSVRMVQAVATQGYSTTFDLSTFFLDCSSIGNIFTRVPGLNGTQQVFNGSGSNFATITKQVLPIPQQCRYLRFVPNTWTGSHPGFRVEVYACEL